MEPENAFRRFPAEWEKHEATWIFWPTGSEAYLYGKPTDYPLVRDAFVQLIDRIAAFEPVRVVVSPKDMEEARSLLGKRADQLLTLEINDAWARDAAPTFLHTQSGLSALCWTFTGWGGRFRPYDKDAKVAPHLATHMGIPVLSTTFAMEGGGVHSNGEGTLLTTDPVLFDSGRNPQRKKESLRTELQNILGAQKALSLPAVFDGDDTGGHVDVIAAFHPEGMVLLNDCRDAGDPNKESTEQNERYLRGEKKEVVRIPQPEATYSGQDRLAHSYLNFYICNHAVILPSFGSTLDQRVRDQFRELFPHHDIVCVEARPFYWGGGGIHCVTQQQPERIRSSLRE